MPTSATKLQRFKKIAVTTGDPRGIGFEVTTKALVQFSDSNKKIPLFFLFREENQIKKQPKLFKLLDSTFSRLTFNSLDKALAFTNTLSARDIQKKRILIDLSLKTSAADWIFQVTSACINQKLDSLVTAPLSKTLIQRSGYKQLGHTGIFRTFFPRKPLHMGFVGRDFSVMIATDHIPLNKVESTLTRSAFKNALESASLLKKALGSNKKIAVLGLNPHAGESGLIGLAERKLFRGLPLDFDGPLVPDAAFLKKNWNRYACFVCLYHDQGLIPFKMQHGQDSGVHVTLGLPFVRTSVDHGTAFDIYNKNLANPASMLDAICFNLKLLETT